MLDAARGGREVTSRRKDRSRPELGPLFSYIWRNSRKEQVAILAAVVLSLPFYFYSLELPKSIVNDAIQGRAFKHGATTAPLFAFEWDLPGFLGGPISFPGMEFDRYSYLFILSGLFMGLVLINGAFRYVINMQKGKLGERLLRRMRLDLFSLLLLFTPETMRNVKPSEVATIIKDEVEPIGGFVGDAFIQPAFLGSQALTALFFILMQSPSLGIFAGGIVLAQGLIIPRLRREQLRLGRERQLRSRHLAGHIGEVVDGKAEVENHGTAWYERYKVARQLDQLFWIRYDLYGRKFMVKFINSVLAQVTPFLFYSIGGYYALRGSLDIGQLVAVISAYRDLPPPVKELIDWDQQRMDVAVKYQQIVEQFAGVPPASDAPVLALPPDLAGSIEMQGVKVRGASGETVLEGINASLPLGSHVALVSLSGDGAETLAKVLGRRITVFDGTVRVAGQDLAGFDEEEIGARMAYFGPDAALFQGTIRDNVLYSLNRPSSHTATLPDLETILRPEANPDEGATPLWIDFSAAGAKGPDDIDDQVIEALDLVGIGEAVYRLGLGRRVDGERRSELADRIVEMRKALNATLAAENASNLIEPLDPERFNRNATLGENLLFGVMRDSDVDETALFADAKIRSLLEAEGLTQDLADVGLKIAATMIEIFSGVSADHFLFERFSFIAADELPEFQDIIGRATATGVAALPQIDSWRLMTLALSYVEPRHRLGLVGPGFADRIVRARMALRQTLPPALAEAVEFYDPAHYCAAAPLRDNLLFGRIDQSVAGATELVFATLHRLLRESGLEREIYRIGLDFRTGPAGRLLPPGQRSAVALARCLVKRPAILVLDSPISVFGEAEGRSIIERVRGRMSGSTLIVAMRDAAAARTFDLTLSFAGGRLRPVAADPAEIPASEQEPEQAEIAALRAVPMFAAVDSTRLKLIAFTSDRMSFASGQTMCRQGDLSESAYVLLDGEAEVLLETRAEPIHIATIGAHAIVGEMGVITGASRSATVIAKTPVTAIQLSRDVVLGLISEFPQIALAMLRDQIRKTVHMDLKLARAALPARDEASAEAPEEVTHQTDAQQ